MPLHEEADSLGARMSQPAWRRTWEHRILSLTWQINATAWLELFVPAAFCLSTAGAISLYALRRLRDPLAPAVWVLLAALALAALACLWVKRRAFFNRVDTRVLLEYQLGLNAALSAAETGLAPWPDPGEGGIRILRRRSHAHLAWFAACTALVIASLQLPVPPLRRSVQAVEKSPSLADVERLVEELRRSDFADAAAVERLAQEARVLGNRPPEQQYSHSALEAAEQLRDQALADTQNLASRFEEAAKAIEDVERSSSGAADAKTRQAEKTLQTSLKGMRTGQLTANERLASQLEKLTASQLRQLSSERLSQMRQAMQQAGERARGVAGAQKKAQVAKGNGERIDLEPAPTGGGPGAGGDPAPLAFHENSGPELAGKTDTLSSEDFSRAALGDNLKTTDGRHEADPSRAAGAQAAGTVSSPARGGDAVWINRLTPAERAALRDFFK